MAYTKYPKQIDTTIELPIIVDMRTPIIGEVINRHRDAIIAIESELGINPSKEYGNVRDRLDILEQRTLAQSVVGVRSSSEPANANSLVRYDGESGTLIEDSGVYLDDENKLTNLKAVTLLSAGLNRIIIDANQNNGFIGVGILSPISSEKLNINGNSYLNGDCTVTGQLICDSLDISGSSVTATGNPTYNFGSGVSTFGGNITASGGIQSGDNISFLRTVSSPQITQSAENINTSSSNLLIQAQSNSVLNGSAGDLLLLAGDKSGGGSGSDGSVYIRGESINLTNLAGDVIYASFNASGWSPNGDIIFEKNQVSPQIYQETEDVNTVSELLTIHAQDNSVLNGTAGSVVIKAGNKSGGGSGSHGSVLIKDGANATQLTVNTSGVVASTAVFSPYLSTTTSGLSASGFIRLPIGQISILKWLRNDGLADVHGISKDTSDNFYIGDATHIAGTYISGAYDVFLANAYNTQLRLNSYMEIRGTSDFRFDKAVAAPVFSQESNDTSGITAQPLTIQAQRATHASSGTGGDIKLLSGNGPTASGDLYLGPYGTTFPTAGRFRLATGDAFVKSNTKNLRIWGTSSSDDNLLIGGDDASTWPGGLYLGAQSIVLFRTGGNNALWVDGSSVKLLRTNLVFGNGAGNTNWSPSDYNSDGPWGPNNLVIRGADCTSAGSYGNSVYIRPGKGVDVAHDGDLYIQDARENNLITIIDGIVNITATLTPTGDIVFLEDQLNPNIYQATEDDGTSSDNLTIHAQNNSVTDGTAGNLYLLGGLKSGGGTGYNGDIYVGSETVKARNIKYNAATHHFYDGATLLLSMQSSVIDVCQTHWRWAANVSGPTISQATETSEVTSDTLTLTAQSNSATDGTAGNLVLRPGGKAGGGTGTHGSIQIQDGTTAVQMTISTGLVNFNGSSITSTGNPTWNTGTGNFTIGGDVYLNSDDVIFGENVNSPEIYQTSTSAHGGYSLTIKSQSATGYTGGHLVLNAGDSSGNNNAGSVYVDAGNNASLSYKGDVLIATSGTTKNVIIGDGFNNDDIIINATSQSGSGFRLQSQNTDILYTNFGFPYISFSLWYIPAATSGWSLQHLDSTSAAGGDITIIAQGTSYSTSNGGSINLKSGTSTGGSVGTINLYGGSDLSLQIDKASNKILTYLSNFTWDKDTTTPTISQTLATSGSGKTLTISAQSTSAASGAGGMLRMYAGSPGSGGTFGKVYIGGSNNNIDLEVAAATGQISLQYDGGTFLTMSANDGLVPYKNITFDVSLIGVTITQEDKASGTGDDFIIKAQRGGPDAGSGGKLGGSLLLYGGAGGAGSVSQPAGPGSDAQILGGPGGTDNGGGGGPGGYVAIRGGDGTGNEDGGHIYLRPGDSAGSGAHGSIYLGDQRCVNIQLGNATDNSTVTQVGTGDVTFLGKLKLANDIEFTDANAAVTISQITTSGHSGYNLAISAQPATGASNAGGSVFVEGGSSGSAMGGHVSLITGTGTDPGLISMHYSAGSVTRDANEKYQTSIGYQTRLHCYGEIAHANGRYATNGDSQVSHVIMRGVNTETGTLYLYADGSSKKFVLPAGRTAAVHALIVAGKTDGVDVLAAYEIFDLFGRYSSSGNTFSAGTVETRNVGSISGATITLEPNPESAQEIAVKVVTSGSPVCTWTAYLTIVLTALY